jgi:hypothetical protein
MPGEIETLAQFAGQTVAAAAVTDAWEWARGRFARLIGRGDARQTQVADGWLAQTREQVAAATPDTIDQARQAAAERWSNRFDDLLDQDPELETELRTLTDEVAARLPAGPVSAVGTVSAAGGSIAAGRDVSVNAWNGGTAAGVINGNVTPGYPPGNPTLPGPARP